MAIAARDFEVIATTCLKLPALISGATSPHRRRLLVVSMRQVDQALDRDRHADDEDRRQRIQEESSIPKEVDNEMIELHRRRLLCSAVPDARAGARRCQ